MQRRSMWIWLSILSVINLGSSVYYGSIGTYVLCIMYGVFGVFWAITAYFQFTKLSATVEQSSKNSAEQTQTPSSPKQITIQPVKKAAQKPKPHAKTAKKRTPK